MTELLEQITIRGQLEALTPLHVGTGEFCALREIVDQETLPKHIKDDQAKLDSLVAMVARDVNEKPCIPATTLKGCLRSACRQSDMEEEVLKKLFGEIHDEEQSSGEIGALRFRLANFVQMAPSDSKAAVTLPYYSPQRASYILTRVAIDRHTGTAQDKKLFNQEMVPKGALFSFRLDFAGNKKDFEDDALRVLNLLAGSRGVALGKGQGLGQGQVRLKPETVTWERTYFDPDKFSKKLDTSFTIPIEPEETLASQVAYVLRLECDGPYLTSDPFRAGEKENPGDPSIQALQSEEGQPLLLPSSLLGVLRSKMAWQQALALGRQVTEEEYRRDVDDPERKTGWASPADLTPTERLFGVTGWRKLVRVEYLELKGRRGTCDATSVALDRFTGGPLDGALFTTHAYHGVEFEVKLGLEKRGHQKDEEAFRELMESICEEGLILGHGGNKGFGWFKVERLEEKNG